MNEKNINRICGLESEGPFLKVRGYNVSGMMQIHNFLNMLRDKLENPDENVVDLERLQKDQILVCRTKDDGQWYRCKVVNCTDYAALNSVGVQMMEFGSELVVPLRNLRDISSLCSKSASMRAPAQHKAYYIQGIVSKVWIPDKVERIKVVLTSTQASIRVEPSFTVNEKYFAVVNINGNDVAEICMIDGCGTLVSKTEQMAIAREYWNGGNAKHKPTVSGRLLAPSPDLLSMTAPKQSLAPSVGADSVYSRPDFNDATYSTPKLDVGSMRSNRNNDLFASASPAMFSGMQSNIQAGGSQHPNQTPNVMSPPKKSVNTPAVLCSPGMHAVSIIYIDDGPQRFFIHLQTDEHRFSEICSSLNQITLTMPAVITTGLPCVVKANDGVFRALVTSCEQECTVQFVDLGLTRTVSYSDIYEMPAQYTQIGQLAYKFCLAGLRSNPLLRDKDAVSEHFETIAKKAPMLRLQVAPADGLPITQYCNLFVGNRNVLDLLIEEMSKALQFATMTLEDGTHHEVTVSFVETEKTSLPWGFYVQLTSEKAKLEKLAVQLAEHCNQASIPDAKFLKASHPVLALSEVDNKWHRALIISVSGNKATVMFMDWGKTEDVPLARLRAASRQLINALPAQAVKCMLDGNSFESQAALLLEHWRKDKLFIMTVLNKVDSLQALNVKMVENNNSTITLNAFFTMEVLKRNIGNRVEENKAFLVPDMTVPPPPLGSPPKQMNRDPRLESRSRGDCRKPDKALYMLPKAASSLEESPLPAASPPENRKRRDWDNPSNNYFADKSNPFTLEEGSGKKDIVEWIEQYERPHLKRSSSGGDDWAGKRKPSQHRDMKETKSESTDMAMETDNKDWKEHKFEAHRRERSNEGRGFQRDNKNWRDRGDGDGMKHHMRSENRRENSFNKSGDRGSRDYHNKPFLGDASQTGRHSGGDKGHRSFADNKVDNNFGFGQSNMVAFDQGDWDSTTTVSASPHPKLEPCPVKIGETLLCTVVFITNPSDFFVQPLNNAHKIDEITSNSTAEFAKNLKDVSGLSVGDGCWAKYASDGLWYRAMVTEIKDNEYGVVFVDYGNSSKVSKVDLQPLKPEDASLPSQAICCTMRGVDKSEWSVDETVKFENEFSDKEAKVTFVAKVGDKFSVVMNIGDLCVNMTSLGASSDSLLPLKSIPIVLPEPMTVIQNATISWFKSPSNFHIHSISSCDTLRLEIEKPADGYRRLQLTKPEVGTLVHMEIEQKLWRGQIVGIREKNGVQCRVKLVDSGRFMITSSEQLTALPEELAKQPQQAIHCSLADVQLAEGKVWPVVGSNPQFDGIFQESPTFEVTVKSVLDEGQLQVCLQREDGNKVSDLLIEHQFAIPITKACDKEKAAPNSEWKVFTSFYENNNRFYVQKEADQKNITELLAKLQQVKIDPIAQLEIGNLVLAKNPEDQFWYRCTITEIKPTINGFLIDYGNSIAVSEAAALPSELTSIPPFAACCSIPLCALPDLTDKVDQEIQEDLFQDTALTMKIEAVTDEYLLVDFQLDGQTLIEKFCNRDEAIRTFFYGYISNIDSLDAIDCQDVANEADLAKVTEVLLKSEEFPDLEEIKLGKECVAKFADDGLWYRANISSLQDGATEVIFHDYGNSAVVTELKKMPESLENIKWLCQLVKMINVPVGNVVENKLYDMLSDSSVKYGFFAPSPRPKPLEVVIFKDGIDIRKIACCGLNIMAEEFKPRGCFAPPADLIKIAVSMSGSIGDNDAKQVDFEMDGQQVTIIPETTDEIPKTVLEEASLSFKIGASFTSESSSPDDSDEKVPVEAIPEPESEEAENAPVENEGESTQGGISDEAHDKVDNQPECLAKREEETTPEPTNIDVNVPEEEVSSGLHEEPLSVVTVAIPHNEQEGTVSDIPVTEEQNLAPSMETESATIELIQEETTDKRIVEDCKINSAEATHPQISEDKIAADSDVLSIAAETELPKGDEDFLENGEEEEEDFTLKLVEDNDSTAPDAKDTGNAKSPAPEIEDNISVETVVVKAKAQTDEEMSLTVESNLSELAEVCCRYGERSILDGGQAEERCESLLPLVAGPVTHNAEEVDIKTVECELGQDASTFLEPLPVAKLTADHPSHHGSDMSIDEIGNQPNIIISCSSLEDPASPNEVRRVPKRPLNVDQDPSDISEEVEVKKPSLEASDEAGEQIMQVEGTEDST